MNPILEKIRKLLRMRRGGTPDEVATALRLAQELASKHGIDLDAVDPDAEPINESISQHDQILGARIQWECKYAALITGRFFRVRPILGGYRRAYRITFVGRRSDIEIALYVYHFLVGHFRRQWRWHSGRCRNRQAFLWGMYQGLYVKLQEAEPKLPQTQAPGLVVVDPLDQAIDKFVREHIGETKEQSTEPDCNATQAKWLGYRQGRETEIRSGLTGPRADASRVANSAAKQLALGF